MTQTQHGSPPAHGRTTMDTPPDRTGTAAPAAALPVPFPFAALGGQPQLTTALLLAAIDPALGGVLVEGPRGTAKSTAARALAELLAPAPFVTLPLGASLEAVTGTLDLERALQGHAVRLAPGLLARAHGGVLYVDEINLLPDALVDVLLDAAASGVHVVERDGISHAHAARFVLVGTMNPDEGELRPQLRDRLGLSVALRDITDARSRQAVVRARLAFDADPAAFVARHAAAQSELAARLAGARRRVAAADALPWSDAVHDAVSALCLQARVEGLRADLVMLRAARALAAWQDAGAVGPAHVAEVAELVLRHRRHPDAPASHASQAPPADAPAPGGSPSSSESQSESESASMPESPPPPAPDSPSRSPSAAGPDPGACAPDAAQAEGDWGALLPEPVAIARVKPVRPLTPLPPRPAKKA